ncbi:MAG: elongation factor 1-beta [Candidatus Diapherotrites archaeon]|nr:elongation factor 1-beta [Candidatus Diapherotrites archaeon]
MPADTFVILKVSPEEPGIEKALETEIRKIKIGQLMDLKFEPMAFGLVAIRLGVIVPEGNEGLAETLATELRKIKGIADVEIEGMSLL